MDLRQKELLELKTFTQNVDTEVTMLLQSLQWDRKQLLEGTSTAICQYDANHRMPKDSLESHESSCVLRSLGYVDNDRLLPDPPDDGAHTLVKFGNKEIQKIINDASKMDPTFKKGSVVHQPLSLARLQLAYTADERRALHDAAVAAVPSCHDLGDLALVSSNEDAQQGSAAKSRVEILAELRNMKRRRTKYRVAAKTKNYSDVLRDVIKTQMESYTEAVTSTSVKTEDNLMCNQGAYSTNNKSMKYGTPEYSTGTKRLEIETSKTGGESRYREEKHRKESSRHRYEDRYDRSESKTRHETYRGEKPAERRKTNSEFNDKRHDDHRDKTRTEENGHRYRANGRKDKQEYDNRKSRREDKYREENRKEKGDNKDKTKTYHHDDSQYIRKHYKKDNCRKEKIKDEPNYESGSNDSYQNHSRRSRRSNSRDKESRKRKHNEEDYPRCSGNDEYKRYYDVKKEKF